jgi:hypothetical protein
MCLLLNLRGVNNTLNYPKDTQLNTPSPRPQTCDTALRVVLHGDRPAQPCNFFYPIDFVVKHPVAPEISPVPTLGWVRTAANFLALLKDQHPWFGRSSLNRGTVRIEHFSAGICYPTQAKSGLEWGTQRFLRPNDRPEKMCWWS